MMTASVFSNVRNIFHLALPLAGRRVGVTAVPSREPDGKGRSAPDFARDTNGAVELLDDTFRDRQSESKSVMFRRDELVEDVAEAFRRDAGSGVLDGDLDEVARA